MADPIWLLPAGTSGELDLACFFVASLAANEMAVVTILKRQASAGQAPTVCPARWRGPPRASVDRRSSPAPGRSRTARGAPMSQHPPLPQQPPLSQDRDPC